MVNLSTRFFRLDLKSPIIAASSSMTGHSAQIVKLAEAGAGAIVLKSIFEEEIYHQLQEELSRHSLRSRSDMEYLDYFDCVIKEDNLRNYVKLIGDAKAATSVPIVASIHCVSAGDWMSFARTLQDAGADALELNLFVVPSDFNKGGTDSDQFYLETIRKVLQVVQIPVGIKISYYFSNLAGFVKKLSATGIAGITIFNRFCTPDIDIDSQKVIVSDILSSPHDYLVPLRWTGILSGNLDCELAATTGVHSAETALKFILAGASAIQIASVLYNEGPSAIAQMNQGIEKWMTDKGYRCLADFKGSLSSSRTPNPAAYERVQFMKYFGEKTY
jgi:dihydroorotate dehydrogenase (fumarate)